MFWRAQPLRGKTGRSGDSRLDVYLEMEPEENLENEVISEDVGSSSGKSPLHTSPSPHYPGSTEDGAEAEADKGKSLV